MDISVGRVRLEWPLNLGIEEFRAIKPNELHPQQKDTIADVSRLVADVQLWPLFQKRIVINELSLQNARINTDGFSRYTVIPDSHNGSSGSGIDQVQYDKQCNKK